MEQNRNILHLDPLSFLKGTWSLTRRIESVSEMSGQAMFEETKERTLAYSETGKNRLLANGAVVDFYQSYLYRHDGEGGIAAFFTDGRPFHRLVFEDKNRACAHHLCGNDNYRGEYRFLDRNRFSLRWDIKGPKKNFTIETYYTRQESC